MSGATGAIIGIGAAATVGSTIYASNKAADATQSASNAAITQQNQALAQQATLSKPYRDLGSSAIPDLQTLLGLTGPGAKPGNPAAIEKTLSSLPGYQFAKNEGLTATKNAASASGMTLSGNTLEGLDRYSTGLADSTYQSEVGNLENVVNTGQAAAAGQAANVGAAANNVSNSLINQGNNLANIDTNEIAGISKSIGSATNSYLTNQTLKDIYGSGVAGGP